MEYNFYEIYKALEEINICINESNTKVNIENACDRLKSGLNRFMPDFQCNNIIFNQNLDKRFFGVFVSPDIFNQGYIRNLFAKCSVYNNENEYQECKSKSYVLELDGKLFRDNNLSLANLWAIILGEISALNSPAPYSTLKTRIDSYIALNNIHVDIGKVLPFDDVFYLMATIMLHNISSIFTNYYFDCEYIPSIVDGYGLANAYEDAIIKLSLKSSVENLVDHTNVALTWYFTNYEELYSNRYIDSMLKNVIKTESSIILKNLALKVKNKLSIVDDDLNKYLKQSIQESTKRKGLIYQLKHNGLKSIEDDLFEYNMRLRNVETQDDAILLMRQINSRMSILEEYIRDNPDDEEKERWTKCYKDYLALREALSKKTVYNKKMYGLFVDYNALQTMSQTGQLNTYY